MSTNSHLSGIAPGIAPDQELKNEARRIAALRSTGLLDSAPEADYDELVQLAAAICEVPICLISLVDEKRQWFLSRVGLDAPETPREMSFCSRLIEQGATMEVPNTLEDDRFSQNPLVTGSPHIRFYAGYAIATTSGEKLGTLCVIDRKPRQLTTLQRTALEVLSRQVTAQIELKTRVIESEASLAQSEARYQDLLEAAPDGVVVVNEANEIVLVNLQAEKQFGYRRDELVGHTITEIIPQGLAAELISNNARAQTNGSIGPISAGIERSARRKSGAEFPIEILLSSLATEDEILVTAAIRDVTERKRAEALTREHEEELSRQASEIRSLNEALEEKIARRTAQLEAVNLELEAFSYSVSHELRAPLRRVTGHCKSLDEFSARMPVEARGHLRQIEEVVGRTGQMIDAVLRLAQIGQQSLRLRHTELNRIVAEVISVLEPECAGRAVEWRMGELPTLNCDPILTGQVFQNLLSNALNYSRGRIPAVIEVGSMQQAGKASVLFVRDNGVGFEMEYAKKVFGVFERLRGKIECEGTGVGLATVHRIVQKHGGIVWADAKAGHGATFSFTLTAGDPAQPGENHESDERSGFPS